MDIHKIHKINNFRYRWIHIDIDRYTIVPRHWMDECHTEVCLENTPLARFPVVYEGHLCGVSRWLAPGTRGHPHTSQQEKRRGYNGYIMVVGRQSFLGFHSQLCKFKGAYIKNQRAVADEILIWSVQTFDDCFCRIRSGWRTRWDIFLVGGMHLAQYLIVGCHWKTFNGIWASTAMQIKSKMIQFCHESHAPESKLNHWPDKLHCMKG